MLVRRSVAVASFTSLRPTPYACVVSQTRDAERGGDTIFIELLLRYIVLIVLL